MKLLDLFTGTGSVAKVARDLGYEVTTLDIDARCNPDICADVLEFDYMYKIWKPGEFDIVWASPLCDFFSCARKCNIGRYVRGELMTAETLVVDTESLGLPILRRRVARLACHRINAQGTQMIEQPVPRTAAARWLAAQDGEAEKSLVEAHEPLSIDRAGVRAYDDAGR